MLNIQKSKKETRIVSFYCEKYLNIRDITIYLSKLIILYLKKNVYLSIILMYNSIWETNKEENYKWQF